MLRKNKQEFRPLSHVIIAIVLNAILIGVIAVASIFIYRYMLNVERENCWNILHDSADSVEDQINTKIEDNINVLKLVANSMITENRTAKSEEDLEIISSHLQDFQQMTIFCRIDLLFGNGKILLQNEGMRESELDFQALAEKGVHVSGRQIDVLTGKESVYCVVPVVKEEQTIAILLGMLDCAGLPAEFNTSIYDGQAYVCLVDRPSGDFIMDAWHDTLGNVYEQSKRKNLPGYENVDIRQEIPQGNTGVVAYESRVNGENSYMYFKPVESVEWELIVVVQEKTAFRTLAVIRKMLTYLGIIQAVMLISYLIWTMLTLTNTVNSKNEFERLSYTDAGTGANNRQALYQHYGHVRGENNVGIVFCDITGLKYVNDTRGHSAGDELILNTYKCLQKGFEAAEIFRVGGDEFLILSIGKEETRFRQGIQNVREALREMEIVVAIGDEWTPALQDTVEQMIASAEKKMYAEKNDWYKKTGKDRRRN